MRLGGALLRPAPQFLLHRLERPDGEAVHREHLSASCEDPSRSLLAQLRADIGDHGTLIVWNKTFEMTCNKKMGEIHPEYATFLEYLNQRIYDLGEIINQGIYLHPGFKGSWSIKNVLPVMVPELSYADLAIHKGDQASNAWWQICFGQLPQDEKEKLKAALWPDGEHIEAKLVARSAKTIADAAGIAAPEGVRFIMVLGKEPIAQEKFADENDVKIMRERNGTREVLNYDLEPIRKGEVEDPVVHTSDVVVVARSDGRYAWRNAAEFLRDISVFGMLF